MALGARLGVFGGPLSSRGPKTSLAATSEARKAIVDDELSGVFPLEEKVGFSDHLKTPISSPPRGPKRRRLLRADRRMTSPRFVCNRTSHRRNS